MIFSTVAINAVNRVSGGKRLFLASLQQTGNEYLYLNINKSLLFSFKSLLVTFESSGWCFPFFPCSPCYPCSPNLLHVLPSGWQDGTISAALHGATWWPNLQLMQIFDSSAVLAVLAAFQSEQSNHLANLLCRYSNIAYTELCELVSSNRSSFSDDGLLYIRGGSSSSHLFRFSLSTLMQLMLQVSL